MELTDIGNQMDVTDIYRTFHSNTKEYTFFSVPNETLFKIDQKLSHKASLNRFKKIYNHLHPNRPPMIKTEFQ